MQQQVDTWLALVLSGKDRPDPEQGAWTSEVEHAPPGIDSALAWLLEHGRGADALKAATALRTYWQWRGQFPDGVRWTRRILAEAGDVADELRARGLASLAVLYFRTGETESSRRAAEACLTLARPLGDPALIIDGLASLARVGLREHDFGLVARASTEGMKLAESVGRPELQRLPLHCLAEGTRLSGDLVGARPLYKRSIELNLGLGNTSMVAMERSNLAALEIADGHPAEARRLLEDAVPSLHELGDLYVLPYGLLNAGGLALAEGDPVRAARLLGAADGIFQHAGAEIDPADRPVFDSHVASARDALGEGGFRAAWESGHLLSVDMAVEEALSPGASENIRHPV